MKPWLYRGLPVLGIVGRSGSGKTTTIKSLLPLLRAEGINCAVIKHAHHEFDIDQPRKDSYELRTAGADQVLVGSGQRWALMKETFSPPESEPDLIEFLHLLDTRTANLILVEGFRHVSFPKIEIHRANDTEAPLFLRDRSVIAVLSDTELRPAPEIPALPLGNALQLARFVETYCRTA